MKIHSQYSACGTFVAVLFSAASIQAASIYTSGHGDIGIGYDSGVKEFEPHWHLHAGAVVDGSAIGTEEEHEPDALIAETSASRIMPTGLSAGLGLPEGSTIYVMGSSAYPPNLGFAAEELDPLDWAGNITLSFMGSTVPAGAAFSLYTTNTAGSSVVDVLFSTANSGATIFGNSLPLTPGDHLHFQWGFSQPGTYSFDFTWNGTHVTDGAISTSGTYQVNVVPEPSGALLATSGMLLLALRRKR